MTVYEMIQELSQYNADAEIEVNFTTSLQTEECECGEEVKFEGEEKTVTDFSVKQYSNNRYLVHIECEER